MAKIEAVTLARSSSLSLFIYLLMLLSLLRKK